MYQELQVFKESFDRHPVWSTEGNDLPLPTLAVGDLFAHDSLPNIFWERPPEPGQTFRVTAIRHVFRESGRGPEADHVLQVTVTLDDLTDRQEAALIEAEEALERQTRRADFLEAMAREQAQRTAPDVLDKIVESIASAMKNTSAHGVEDEASSAWDEAAAILQADDHLLAEMVRSDIAACVRRAVKSLSRDEQLAVWLASMDLSEYFGKSWPDPQAGFDASDVWDSTMEDIEDKLSRRLLGRLHQHPLTV